MNNILTHEEKSQLNFDFNEWKHTVNSRNRFDINNPFLKNLDYNNSLYSSYVDRGDTFYRGRIFNINDLVKNDEQMDEFLNYDGLFQGYSSIESGAPPVEKTADGRLNCRGIPYLYTSDSVKTAVYELRPIFSELMSIAECVPNQRIKLADCTRYSVKELKEYDIRLSWLLRKISIEFSRPHYGWHNYWFTQYLAGHFFNMGFSGVIFESSLNRGGENYVFFYPEKCDIIKSSLIRVSNIDISYQRTPKINMDTMKTVVLGTKKAHER